MTAFFARATQSPRFAWCPPAPGRRPDAFPRGPLSRATLPAAAASPQPHTRPGRPRAPLVVSIAFSQLLTLGPSLGECSRGLGCTGPAWAIPPPTPTQAYLYGTQSLPSHGRYAASAFGACGSAASVSSPFSGPMPSVHSPLRAYDSADCSQRRVACGGLPAKSESTS